MFDTESHVVSLASPLYVKGAAPTPVELKQTSLATDGALAEKVISAHLHVVSLGQLIKYDYLLGEETYVVKSTTIGRELDNLDTRIGPFLSPRVLWQRKLGETECPVPGLVEGCSECDVEAGDLVAKTEVYVGLRESMARSEDKGAAVDGPEGTVVCRDCLVNTTTWKD